MSLDVEDVSETADGLIIRVRRSKADPEAQGISVALPYDLTAPTCPVRSYRAWIAMGIEGGPVFRSVDRHGRVSGGRMNAGSVARLIRRAALASGGSRSRQLCRPQPPRRFCDPGVFERGRRGLQGSTKLRPWDTNKHQDG